MEWTNKLETRSDGSEVDTFEVGRIKRGLWGWPLRTSGYHVLKERKSCRNCSALCSRLG